MHSLLSGNAEATTSPLPSSLSRSSLVPHGCCLFVLRMDYGLWTENSRGTYNKWDGVARSTIQVLKLVV